jgi:hypothetical protein
MYNKKKYLSILYNNKNEFRNIYFNLSKKDLDVEEYDDYYFYGYFSNSIKHNEEILKKIKEEIYSHNVSLIITQSNKLNSLVAIDICLEKQQAKERSNNYFIRFYYHKKNKELLLYSEKKVALYSYKKYFRKKKIFRSVLEFENKDNVLSYFNNSMLENNLFLNDLKVFLKGSEIMSFKPFSFGGKYKQTHYVINNSSMEEKTFFFKDLAFNVLKNLLDDYIWLFSKDSHWGDYSFWNNMFNEYFVSPLKKLEYLKLKGIIENNLVDENIQEEKQIKYIKESGRLYLKRNKYDLLIKNNGLIKEIIF